MSVLSLALVVFGLLSFFCTFMVIISAIRSGQTARYVENQEKLRRIAVHPNPELLDSGSSPMDLHDVDATVA